jgi:hypothetical protein
MRTNVSRVLNSNFTNPITMLRANQNGAYVNGVYKKGNDTKTVIQASVQPFDPEQYAMLPEGVRNEEAIWVYASQQMLGPLPENNGDRFEWRGYTWKVTRAWEWMHGGYCRVAAVKLKQGSSAP